MKKNTVLVGEGDVFFFSFLMKNVMWMAKIKFFSLAL